MSEPRRTTKRKAPVKEPASAEQVETAEAPVPAAQPAPSAVPAEPVAADSPVSGTPAGTPVADTPNAEDAATDQEVVVIELTSTQLQNDPLLSASDDVFADLLEKLRWSVVAFAVVGLLASWAFATVIAVGSANASAFAWAGGATVLLIGGAVWYLMRPLGAFADADAYLRAKSPYALARLDRAAVVGLPWQIALWVGWALLTLALACGILASTLSLAGRADGWLWLVAAVPLAIAYLAWFGLLQYRLIERTRDAVA
ncbi:MAG TPA: hypothetical protein VN133_07400 [Humibacter sp.]|nr:hypothetical protein [Humibacter sp.]